MLVVKNPFNQRKVATLKPHNIKAARRMLIRSKAAGVSLRSMPRYQRSNALSQISEALVRRREFFAKTIMQEAGKPITLARVEVDRAVFTFKYAAQEILRYGVESIPMDLAAGSEHQTGVIERFPVGPIVGIAPFNFPLNLVAHKVAPALAVGCPILIKPNVVTPLVALELKKLVDATEFPKDSMQVMLLPGADAESLLSDPDCAMVSFTGSAAVGWHIKKVASEKKVALELGGNAMAVLAIDGRVDPFVQRVVYGAFGYAGQSCISVQTALIHQKHYAVVKQKIVKATQRVGFGNPSNAKVICGPVINEAAADRIINWINDAKQKGAKVLCGGHRKGLMIAPTVLENVPDDTSVFCEEVFGPVLILRSFKSDESAIETINNGKYGLQSGVFTRDHDRIRTYFENLDVGGVVVNEVPTYRLDHMPYGGVKQSGFGREGLRWAMDEMTEPRLLIVRRAPES